jgi:lipopolysaccharide transport system ATP-binding protein
MSDIAIRIENLGKAYTIAHNAARGNYKTLQEDLLHLLKRPFSPRGASRRETFWALKDVSFEVKQGEVLGIIGRNGAGKSTLLKILSRITRPTTGYAEMYGRVGSLLEVGTGFHPELTGRENIFLNGAVLGMNRSDIQRKFDEIVQFAEVEQFLDTPVKRYSSGMYMRLAFAVAAHLEPEILVVDEVLAVGDAEFQKKSLGKMSEVAKGGRTVVFVSHNMAAVTNLCSRVVSLEAGRVRNDGPAFDVVEQYLSQDALDDQGDLRHRRRGPKHLHLFQSVRLFDGERPTHTFRTHGAFLFEVECLLDPQVVKLPSVGFNLKDTLGVMVCSGHLNQYSDFSPDAAGMYKFRGEVTSLPLAPGRYELSLFLGNGTFDLDVVENAASFEVIWNKEIALKYPPPSSWGALYLPVVWRVFSGQIDQDESESTL